MYGMSMRPVPETWEEFQAYWDRKCSEELEINKANRRHLHHPHPQTLVRADANARSGMSSFRPMVGAQRWIAAGAVRRSGAREGRHAVDNPATRCCCGYSASSSKWHSSWCRTRSGSTHAALAAYRRAKRSRIRRPPRLSKAPAFMSPPRRPARPAHALRPRPASHCSIGRAPLCTPRSLWRACRPARGPR